MVVRIIILSFIHPMTPEQIVKDDLARAAITAKQLDPSPSVPSEIKMKAPVLLATSADFDDLLGAHLPCYALVCSSVLIALDDAPSLAIPPMVANLLQEYADVFPKTYHQVSHRFVALSTRSTSSPAHSIRTAHRTVQIHMRRRRFSARYRRCLTRDTFVSLLALALFLCYFFPRKIGHGVCV
jgi:hypothetical protein